MVVGRRSIACADHLDGEQLLPLTAAGPASTATLLRACREGDADAWNRLVERYERLVFSVALHNGLSREDAADVMQTTFVVLLESLDRIHNDESLGFWLMTVARRHAWRVRKRRDHEWLSDDVVELPDDPVGVWDDMLVVHEALEQLAPPCRDLILALYFDPTAPSYSEIADRLGRAIGGIGPLRARCLDRLRALIGDSD